MTIYYLHFGAQYNGNGLSPLPAASPGGAGAFNTPPTLTAGNVYRVKRGTTYVDPAPASHTPLLIDTQNATANAPTTIEAYYNDDGTDDPSQPLPVINHNGGGNGQAGVRVKSSSHVLVRNIKCINNLASGGGFAVTAGSSNVRIESCLSENNTIGIFIQQAVDGGTISDVTTYRNEITGCGGGILHRYNDAASTYLRNITHQENYIHDNLMESGIVASTSRGGISTWHAASGSATILGPDRGYRNYKLLFNRITNGNGYGIATHGVREGGLIYGNHVYSNNLAGALDTHGISVQASYGVVVEANVIHDNIGKISASAGSQVSIFMDWDLNNAAHIGDANVVRGNYIYNGWRGPTLVTQAAAAGVYLLNQQNTIVENNLIVNCPTGITTGRDSPANPANIIRNNSIVDTLGFDNYTGVAILVDTGNNHQIYNNLIKTASKIGIFVNSALTGIVERNNVIYDTLNPKVSSAIFTTLTPATPDVTDVLTDPLLDDIHCPTESSPARGAGLHVGYRTDRMRRQFYNPPAIGAHEYVGARTARV